jgi:hypothetical protein
MSETLTAMSLAHSRSDEPEINYSVLYQQQKQIHELEKKNLELRQQIVEDRRRFEDEKQNLLVKQEELHSRFDEADLFHSQLCELLEIPGNSESARIIESVQNLVNRKMPEDFSSLQEASGVIASKDRQLADLEVKFREVRRLYRASESDNATNSAELSRFRRKFAKQSELCEKLKTSLESHLALTGRDTPEASLNALRIMKTKLYKYKAMIREGLGPNPQIAELRELIFDQSETIDVVLRSLREFREQFTEVTSPENPFRKIPADSHPRIAPNGFLQLPYDDRRASLWMSKTRELLALERQLLTAQKRLVPVQKHSAGTTYI